MKTLLVLSAILLFPFILLSMAVCAIILINPALLGKEIKQPYYKGIIYNPVIKRDWCCGMSDKDKCLQTLANYAKYDSDANWQFEAIDWIEKQGYFVKIYGNSCEISKRINHGANELNIFNSLWKNFKNKKEAIFEALYQFSQYLKHRNEKIFC